MQITQQIEDVIKIKRLKLSHLDLSDKALVQNVVDILHSNYNLTYLNLAHSSMKLADLVRVSSEFKNCTMMEYMNISGNQIFNSSKELQDEFVKSICEFIELPATRLKYLDLSDMGFNKIHLKRLCVSVLKNTILQSINFG